MDIVKGNMGWIEVIVGPMFSGKSEELIRRLRRAEIGKQRVQIFKPVIDQRYSTTASFPIPASRSLPSWFPDGSEILEKVVPRTEVVGIDEAQFLGESIVADCAHLAELGKRVIVTGLDTDFMGRPFEPMPRLLAVAEEITKLLAICMRCGNPAVHTQRLVASEELIVVGAERNVRSALPPLLRAAARAAENRRAKGRYPPLTYRRGPRRVELVGQSARRPHPRLARYVWQSRRHFNRLRDKSEAVRIFGALHPLIVTDSTFSTGNQTPVGQSSGMSC